MINPLAARLQDIETSIFSTMSALAVRTGSLNLGQGFPDEEGPAEIVEAASTALHSGRNQYPPGIGFPELRRAVAEHQKRFYGLSVDPDSQVIVTTGATEAITAAVLAHIDPGDEVVMLEPYYDSYVGALAMAGGVRVPVTLHPPDFTFDPNALRKAVTPRTKALLINSPHNPTGAVLTDEELAVLAEVANEHDLLVITDEVYEHLTFDGAVHRPLATLDGMAERTISISSGAKTFAFTGWKVGWVTGPERLVHNTMMAKQFMSFASGAPLQPAIATALGLGDAYFEKLRADLRGKRDRLCAGLSAVGFDVFVPKSTYFVNTDISPLGYDDAMQFCLDLPERCGVVAIPHEPFYDNKQAAKTLVRWAFCKDDAQLDEAVERLGVLRRG